MQFIAYKYRSLFLALLFCGLLLRIAGILFLEPQPIAEWFSPFVSSFLDHPCFDPWTQFFPEGSPKSFPYGIMMFLSLLPTSFVAWVIDASPLSVSIGIKFAILCADCSVFYLLLNIRPKNTFFLLFFWWLCPLILITNYWIGQLDIIPVTFLLASIVCIQKKKFLSAGFLNAFALSAKLSMALALPFLCLYFLRNKRMWKAARTFFIPFLIASLVLQGMPLFSDGYISMVLETSEMTRLFDLCLEMGAVKVYLTPILYSIILYSAWRVSFFNFDLLIAFIALGMFSIVLSTTTPPGWHLWAWSFVLLLLMDSSVQQRFLGMIFSFFVAVSQILFWSCPVNLQWGIPLPQAHLFEIVSMILIAMGIILAYNILSNGIRKNTFFKFFSRPVSIAIAGDSGVGKDTLVTHLIDLLGIENTIHISGDDYHKWDRDSKSWKLFTHLNPRANDLRQLFSDIDDIMDGKKIYHRHYQHSNGKFSDAFYEKSRHFFIVSGLHTLLSRTISKKFDLRIYIDMDDSLRFYFKCRRDVLERGKKIEDVRRSIEERLADGERYIVPQKKYADIIFIRRAVNPQALDWREQSEPQTQLEIHLKDSLYYESLLRHLISISGLNADIDETGDGEIILTVDGNIRGEDMSFLGEKYFPEFNELIALDPKWADGSYGLMQLIILYQLHQNLLNRIRKH